MRALRITLGVLILLILAAFLFLKSYFVVDEMHYAVVTQFGEPKREIPDPGLYFRKPFIQQVHYLPKQVLRWRSRERELVTRDKTYIRADSWARWKILDPLKFYKALRTEANGHGTLDDQIESAMKDTIASHDLIEVVRNSNREMTYTIVEPEEKDEKEQKIHVGRTKICELIRDAAANVVTEAPGGERQEGTLQSVYGIELIDVQVSQVTYVKEVQRAVYERMRAERKRTAERSRSEGKEKANEILGEMQKELLSIQSEGNKRALQLRGEGDAEALSIYAAAYTKDPEFYRFWKTLETYEQAVDERTHLILSLDNEYFKLLGDPGSTQKQSRGSRPKDVPPQ